MTRAQANELLDARRQGEHFAQYAINQALRATGDLPPALFSLSDALEAAKEDRERLV